MGECDLRGVLKLVNSKFYVAPISHRLLIVLLLLITGSPAANAELTARLERARIAAGETVRLLIEAEGQVAGQPDTGPLLQDFDVLGVSSGSQVNIVNGRMDARTTWTITLSPKRKGALDIPPLQVGGEQSPRLTLQVSEAAAATSASGGSPIFIESEVEPYDPYIQAMARYKVRLFLATKLAEGNLSDPQPDNALVRRLGEDRKYTLERNGRRYQVIEREYAVFPQASGELVLPAPVLDARVIDLTPSRRSPFKDFFGRDPFDDMFASTRQVRVRGESQTLTVKPRPGRTSGAHWLPAEHVELTERWQPEDAEIRVGEPLTRTLTLRMRGLTGEQLPNLAPTNADGFKVYPDSAQVDTRDHDRSVLGERVQSVAFVPVRPGRFTLPALRLHWWDTQSDRERIAELPARVIEVLPLVEDQGAGSQPSTVEQQAADLETSPVGNPGPKAGSDGAITDTPVAGSNTWLWVSAIFAVLWLVTLIMWWRDRHRRSPYLDGKTENEASAAKAQGNLRKRYLTACAANDPFAARNSLLDWASAHWPDDPPRGLEDLARRLDDDIAQKTLADLDRILYSGSGQAWSGNALAKVLTRLPKRRPASHDSNLLPDLYG